MRSVTADGIEAELAFARKAADHFAKHPEHSSFGEIEPGALLGLRWGLGDDCVLVVRIDEGHVPTNYQNLVQRGAN